MKPKYRIPVVVACVGLLFGLGTSGTAHSQHSASFERTEERDACASYDPLKQPFFGELHLHTGFSFDAYVFSVRNGPDAAYEFAKGERAVSLPDASARGGSPQTRTAEIRRPLDFAAVTDHSELFGEMEICTRSQPGDPGYNSLQCRQMRTGELLPSFIPGVPGLFAPQAVTGLWALNPILRDNGAGPLLPLCNRDGVDCDAAAVSLWQEVQDAAERHYDRTSDCSFTTFVGYEYTAQPGGANLHRNVIFRNDKVTERAISNVTTGGPFPTVLWQMLREECLEGEEGCDVLTIPHNANVSGGLMFPDPEDADEAAERAFFEPLTEIYQHKGSSECRWDRLARRGVQTIDELCTFEQVLTDVLSPVGPPVPIDEFPPRNMVRNALKDGLALAPSYEGINPFKYGLIGSTDSHNADPGNTVERDFQGHGGTEDAPVGPLIDAIRLGPGGLAVAWAEENSRDSIFEALRRKETYGTSGTRPIVRFFGGWDYDTGANQLCRDPDLVQVGYDQGVPMGADLPPRSGDNNPRFLVAALKDAGSESLPGTPLQRIQVVKGWVDDQGETHEQVLDVAGSSGGGVNPRTCEPVGAGFNELCTVWEDNRFDPEEPAFYYARVLETPTCRWSTLMCKAAGVDPFAGPRRCQAQAAVANVLAVLDGEGATSFENCCLTERNDSFLERTIQERAWTSPIWYVPGE